MIRAAHEAGPALTTPYVFDEDQARAMAAAGADVVVAHMGLTTKGQIGATTALTLEAVGGAGPGDPRRGRRRSSRTSSCSATAARSPSRTTPSTSSTTRPAWPGSSARRAWSGSRRRWRSRRTCGASSGSPARRPRRLTRSPRATPQSTKEESNAVALKEEVLGQFLGDEKFPVDVDVGDREAALLGLRRPALPASAQPDVRGHRRLVALAATTCSAASARRSRPTGSTRTSTATCTRRRSRPRPASRSTTQEYGFRDHARSCPRTRTTRPRSAPTSAPSCRPTASSSWTGGATASSPRWTATSPTSRGCSTSRTSST